MTRGDSERKCRVKMPIFVKRTVKTFDMSFRIKFNFSLTTHLLCRISQPVRRYA